MTTPPPPPPAIKPVPAKIVLPGWVIVAVVIGLLVIGAVVHVNNESAAYRAETARQVQQLQTIAEDRQRIRMRCISDKAWDKGDDTAACRAVKRMQDQ